MSDTRTQGADGQPTAETPRATSADRPSPPTGASAVSAPVGGPVTGPVTEPAAVPSSVDTSARSPWRTKLTGKLAGAVEEHRDSATAPTARPPAPVSARPASRRPRGPRKARLRLTRIDPWSVMKTAFLLSIAFAVVTVVSVTIVWSVLGAAGVWDSVNASVQQVVGGQDTNNFDIENYIGMSRVLGFTMLISVLDIVLITAVSTLSAFLYNLSAALLGGIEVTLAEDGR